MLNAGVAKVKERTSVTITLPELSCIKLVLLLWAQTFPQQIDLILTSNNFCFTPEQPGNIQKTLLDFSGPLLLSLNLLLLIITRRGTHQQINPTL